MIKYHLLENDLLNPQIAQDLETVPEGALWIDLFIPTTQEERFIEKSLGIEIPSPEEMAEIEDSSRFFEENNGICMTISVVGNQVSNPTLIELSFILTQKQLVTVHYDELASFRAFEGVQCIRQLQACKSSDVMMMTLLEAVVYRVADMLEKLQDKLNMLSNEIFDEEKGQKTHELHITLKQVGRYNTLLAKLSNSLLGIRRLLIYCKQSVAWLSPKANNKIHSIEKDIKSLIEFQANMSAELTFLQDATLGLINIEQNSIIKVFSIAAVLFLPPTLVGTVYGMNFPNMPELQWEYGYLLSIGLMLISAVGCYAWFKMKKWL